MSRRVNDLLTRADADEIGGVDGTPAGSDFAGPEQAARVAARKRQRADDLRRVLATESGRRVVVGMIRDARLWSSLYSSNVMDMAYQAGRRDVILGLLEAVRDVDPAAAVEAFSEGQEDRV